MFPQATPREAGLSIPFCKLREILLKKEEDELSVTLNWQMSY